jgi:hypothetical protein
MKKLFLTLAAFSLFILSCFQVKVDSRADSITSFLESYLDSGGERPVSSILVYYEDLVGHQKIAHSFQGPEDITLSGNTSFDWSGGGLVSTTKELAVFIEALMTEILFKSLKPFT